MQKTCENCRQQFESVNPKSTHCQKRECQLARMRKYAKTKYDSMEGDKKKEFIRYRNTTNRANLTISDLPTKTVTAKCPLCEKVYQTTVEGDYNYQKTPRIYCEACRIAVHNIESGDYGKLSFSQMREYHTI